MRLQGSCHCNAVSFSINTSHPYPFNLCYCSICRKTAGGGGFAINLGGENKSLKVEGAKHISVYRARFKDTVSNKLKRSPAERHFCSQCGSALWVWDPRWPELIHPFASAIDTPLPAPPERTHLMMEFKADWVQADIGSLDKEFSHYPDESIAEWHSRLGLDE